MEHINLFQFILMEHNLQKTGEDEQEKKQQRLINRDA